MVVDSLETSRYVGLLLPRRKTAHEPCPAADRALPPGRSSDFSVPYPSPPATEWMESFHDPAVPKVLARVRNLRLREVRDRSGLHFIEGFRNFILALDAGISLETIVYSEVLAQN